MQIARLGELWQSLQELSQLPPFSEKQNGPWIWEHKGERVWIMHWHHQERCSSLTHVRAELIQLQQAAWLLVFWESCYSSRENYSWIKKKKGISSTKCHDCLCSTARSKRDARCSTWEITWRNTNKNALIILERPLQFKPRYHLLIYGEVQRMRNPPLTHRQLIWSKRHCNRKA